MCLVFSYPLSGSNKVAFLITNYTPPGAAVGGDSNRNIPVISPQLRSRLHDQISIRPYLEENQILSWAHRPSPAHAERLNQLAESEPNPSGLTCTLL